MITTHIKKSLYLEGDYNFRPLGENWASIIDFPTVFTASGPGVKSGNWQSCTAINTPEYLQKYYKENVDESHTGGNYSIPYPNLTESERYEFGGLTYAVAHLAEAWTITKTGNHGTNKGTDITNRTANEAIYKALKIPVARANELLAKMRGE